MGNLEGRRRITIDGVEDETKRRERRDEDAKVSSIYGFRLPQTKLLKRKGSNESIAASNTKATKRVEHLINRNSTEGDSQTIFEGTPSRRTWPSNFCSRPAFLPSPPFPGQPRSYIVKYSPFIITFIYPIITNTHSLCPRLVQYFSHSRIYGNN